MSLTYHQTVTYMLLPRWVNKAKNGVSNIVNDVKYRLRRIANSITVEDMEKAIYDLTSWEFFKDKLKSWFNSKFESHAPSLMEYLKTPLIYFTILRKNKKPLALRVETF